ncbi:MAG: mechanosensitive ion channel [Chloroflexota bacterium]|nr:mechanosensitive ion channel [Chloroflexota bacterium]
MYRYLDASLALETRDVVTALVVFGAAVLISLASRFILNQVKARLTSRTGTVLDDLIIDAMTLPLALIIIVAGAYIALLQVSFLDAHLANIRNLFVVVYVFIGTMAAGRAINVALSWYGTEIATRTKTDMDEKLIPVLRRIVTIVIYGIGLIIILDRFNVNISPLIAGLGISGLAVALALQPTLSNFLAGTYVMGDGIIRKGHYIALEGGPEGSVEEIGWRTTKLRHWQGNLIIMPNSKLAEAIVTNFDAPEPPVVFVVECGVSYKSDLKVVERVTLEVARQILQTFPEGAKDFQPVVRFKEFGDSNINFAIVMKSVHRDGQFLLKHEFVKALHQRFTQEGIEIQYPARKLYMANGSAAKLAHPELVRSAEPHDPPNASKSS